MADVLCMLCVGEAVFHDWDGVWVEALGELFIRCVTGSSHLMIKVWRRGVWIVFLQN